MSEGYAAVGYEYVNIDDCWLEKYRSPEGNLLADHKRFPNGIRALSDYVSIHLILLKLLSLLCCPHSAKGLLHFQL